MSEELRRYMALKYEQSGGVLIPEDIHEDVANPAHPLHNRYEWDDSVAGYKYRLQQIAADIRTVQLVFTADDGRTERTRQYLANREVGRPTPGYVAAEEALQDPAVLEFMEKSLGLEITNMRRRFGHLAEYSNKLRAEADREPPTKRPARKPRKRT